MSLMRTNVGGGDATVSGIDALPVRASASAIVAGKDFAPGVVPPETVAWNEKMLSPATASPPEPLSRKGCAAAPPTALRSALTVRPVLVGDEPGVTVTVSSDDSPGCTDDGFAAPTPEGFVVPPHGLGAAELLRGCGATMEKSAALLSVSVQPLAARSAAVVFDRIAVGAASEQLAVGRSRRSR